MGSLIASRLLRMFFAGPIRLIVDFVLAGALAFAFCEEQAMATNNFDEQREEHGNAPVQRQGQGSDHRHADENSRVGVESGPLQHHSDDRQSREADYTDEDFVVEWAMPRLSVERQTVRPAEAGPLHGFAATTGLPPELPGVPSNGPTDATTSNSTIPSLNVFSDASPREVCHNNDDEDFDVVTLGPGVIDISVDAGLRANVTGKEDHVLRCALGGGSANVVRQARRLGANATLIALVGRDAEAALVERLARDEFRAGSTGTNRGPNALFESLLAQTRMSVVTGGDCITRRPPLASHSLSETARARWAEAKQAYLGPLTRADFEFARECLLKNPRTTLALSSDQLGDVRTLELMRLASLTVVNRDELARLAEGLTDADGIRWLRERHVERVLVTSRAGVVGFHHGWLWHPALVPERVANTVGAGDCFVGTLLAARAAGETVSSAIHLGLVACCAFVEGTEPPASLTDLRMFSQTRRPRRFRGYTEPQPTTVKPLASKPVTVALATAAASLLISLPLWM